ncbi:glutamine amidotransferase class-I [Novosphingobium aromaticivorans DSM 12444]|uniref:Glutamine amidotransferase class-I n=1 Tax=Novosphingobium aromaticivorans (strain ATCC 700278 / DSM 12444 / CCUG 56034 / CIP 105152 / NBRC 16084 / F199) TaxID=279238 RepID=Q2G531_NOVAD|nr:type 1 glutamine amidotransferase [Novosphingobium aromaticivorans]ABD27042.1 glutamine amidotransferase class-I [Novosphingobium aromaticivorans DSM 12444]SCY48775.1 GMP synthase (glutamine-hydrolysing) [Novosphingobium aromaticivorans]
MTRLLLLEGNTADKRARGRELGVRSSSEIYAQAIAAHFPRIELDVLNGADEGEAIPHDRSWADYDGFVVTGSSLHAYDREFAVTNQIALVAQAAEHGLPIFGSCWGLQIAVMAAGGEVAYNPRGREVGFARKIALNDAGRAHPMFGAKQHVFDAPCIHYDEVVRMPDGATLLASNGHSLVQAAVIPLGQSEVWAVQYHPEFDLAQLVQLYTLYAADMIAQGFFSNEAELVAYRDKIARLAQDPTDAGLAWQLGIDADVLDPRQRAAEIIAWIESRVLNGT